MEIKSHYSYISDYVDIDESTWNLIFNIIVHKIGKKNIKNYNAWLCIEEAIINKFSDDEEYSYISEFAQFIIPFERAFIVEEFSLADKSDAELLGYYSQLMREKDSENMLVVLSHLGNKYNKYIRYFYLFFNAFYEFDLDREQLKNIVIDLSSKYFEDLTVISDLTSVYASLLICLGQEKKGMTIYDNLIEEDPLNLTLQLRLIDTLEFCNKYELLEEPYKRALELAEELENEDMIDILKSELNDLHKDKYNKPPEVNDHNLPSIIDIINNPNDYKNLQKTIIDVVFNIHPDLMDIVFYSDDKKKVDDANNHIYKSALSVLELVENNESAKKFKKLLKDKNEHEALHIIMKEVD